MTDNNENEARERQREYALSNLSENEGLRHLVTAYSVVEDDGYGKKIQSAVDNELYLPSINSGVSPKDLENGEDYPIIQRALVGSRQNKKMLTGNVSEYDIAKTAVLVTQESLTRVKVSDVLELMNYEGEEIQEELRDKYMFELLESDDEETQNVAKSLTGLYSERLTYMESANALNKGAERISGSLERILTSGNEE